MRRKERKIRDEKVILEIFSHSQICRIALFDNEYPYIVPMNYGYENDILYFHCALEGKKIDLIKRNNKVGFEIEHSHEVIKSDVSCDCTTKYRSIIGYGEIEIISDFDEKIKGLNILMTHHGKKENTYKTKAVERVLVLKLKILDLSAKESL